MTQLPIVLNVHGGTLTGTVFDYEDVVYHYNLFDATWMEVTVDLDDYAGRDVTIEFYIESRLLRDETVRQWDFGSPQSSRRAFLFPFAHFCCSDPFVRHRFKQPFRLMSTSFKSE